MKGFTLIELILILGILAIVSVLAIPFMQIFQVSSDLYTHADTITQTLRRAQLQAIAGQNDSSWGVYFDSGNKKFILFKGEDYSTRDQSYDLQTDYPDIFAVSTDFGDEIYFSIYSGQPSTAGIVTIASPNNDSADITINSFGLIQNL